MDTAEAIIEEIRVAFAGVPRGEITLHEAEEIDNYSMPEVCALARLMDTDTSWDEVPDEHIYRCHCALIYLDPKSWRYYIPAFMVFTLKYYDLKPRLPGEGYHSAASFDSTISSLCGTCSEQRYPLLNEAQSQAVRSFLQYVAVVGQDDSARNAIVEYWNHTEPRSHIPAK
jgi:hypothetical protein